MCSCRFNVVPTANASLYENTIPYSEVTSNSTRGRFKYFFCLSPIKVNRALSVIQVKPNDPLQVSSMAEMEQLADIHDRRDDVRLYNKDFLQLLTSIIFTQEELDKSSCTTAFVV